MAWGCYITFTFYCIYLGSLAHAAFNSRWIKDINSDFRFVIVHQVYMYVTLSKAITATVSHLSAVVKSSMSSSELKLATNTEIAEFGATTVGPFITRNAVGPLSRGFEH
jgi:hypothetical protein